MHNQIVIALRMSNPDGHVRALVHMVGAPAPIVVMMRLIPWIWRKLEAVAHTLPYDAAVMTEFRIPRARFTSQTMFHIPNFTR